MTSPHHPSRRAVLGLIGGALFLPSIGRAGTVDAVGGPAFGTSWRLAAPAGGTLRRMTDVIAALFSDIDRQMSPWRPDSAISRFNAGPAGAETEDGALVEVAAAALDIARASGGAFDPTVGPLVARWGFGPIESGGEPDWRALVPGPGRLTKPRADLTLDLCGIAKGWALDQAAALAREAGIEDLLFDLGGEFVALGRHPQGREWRVAVESPVPDQPSPVALRLPAGMAVATSGTRAQSYTLDGRVYSHIIDPAARAPAAGDLRSVTVVAANAMTADGWATALCAAGDVAGPALADAHGIAALFLSQTPDGLRQVRTGPIAEMIL